MSQSTQHSCRSCGQTLGDPFYRANDRPVCSSCAERLQAGNGAMADSRRTGIAIVAGLVVALAMGYGFAAGWNYFSHPLWPLFTIVMGFAVGWVMQRASAGTGGDMLRWTGVVLAGASVFWGEFLLALLWPQNFLTSVTGTGASAALMRVVSAWGFLDWFYLIIAAWEPFVMIRPLPFVEVAGPYPLTSLEPINR